MDDADLENEYLDVLQNLEAVIVRVDNESDDLTDLGACPRKTLKSQSHFGFRCRIYFYEQTIQTLFTGSSSPLAAVSAGLAA